MKLSVYALHETWSPASRNTERMTQFPWSQHGIDFTLAVYGRPNPEKFYPGTYDYTRASGLEGRSQVISSILQSAIYSDSDYLMIVEDGVVFSDLTQMCKDLETIDGMFDAPVIGITSLNRRNSWATDCNYRSYGGLENASLCGAYVVSVSWIRYLSAFLNYYCDMDDQASLLVLPAIADLLGRETVELYVPGFKSTIPEHLKVSDSFKYEHLIARFKLTRKAFERSVQHILEAQIPNPDFSSFGNLEFRKLHHRLVADDFTVLTTPPPHESNS